MEFYFTVPGRYRTERHPLGVGPNDLIVVEADSETEARVWMNEVHGLQSWCSAYPVGDPHFEEVLAKYYPGRKVSARTGQVIG